MNKDIFNKAISKFELPNSLDKNSIANILEKYPAFNSLELINAIILKRTDQKLLDKKITGIATKVLDRKVLHDVLYKDLLSFTSISIEKLEPKTLEKNTNIEKTETIIVEDKPKIQKEKTIIVEEKTKQKKQIATSQAKPIIVERKIDTEKVEISKPTIKTEIVKAKSKPKVSISEKIIDNIDKTKSNEEKETKKTYSKETIQPIIVKDKSKSKRDDAFKKLSDDLFKDKLNAKKATNEKDRRRLEAMQKLQEELFSSKEKKKTSEKEIKKEDVKTPRKIEIFEDVLEKQEEKTAKTKENIKENVEEANKPKKVDTEKEKSTNTKQEEELIAERRAKALILKIKAQQEKLVKKEEALHLKKIEELKKKLQKKKLLEQKQQEKIASNTSTKVPQKPSKEDSVFNISKLIEKNKETKEPSNFKQKEVVEKIPQVIEKTKKDSLEETKPKKTIIKEEKKNIEQEKNKISKTQTLNKPQKEETKTDFLEWLKSKNSKKQKAKTTKPKKEEKPKKVKQTKENKKEDLVPFERTSAIEAEMHKEIKESTDPLDSFISTQIAKKRTTRRKKVIQKEKKNIFATETLAEIYIAQQKYNEAIEIYSALSLKYPQKSIYFARQIEKIKTYI